MHPVVLPWFAPPVADGAAVTRCPSCRRTLGRIAHAVRRPTGGVRAGDQSDEAI